jgi:hypothetical protein
MEQLEFSEAAKSFKFGKWRHFKGGEYQALYIARDSETQEEMVVYQNLADTTRVWVRPLAMFLESVDKPELGYKGPRFTHIGK